jgi:hypothetical protein
LFFYSNISIHKDASVGVKAALYIAEWLWSVRAAVFFGIRNTIISLRKKQNLSRCTKMTIKRKIGTFICGLATLVMADTVSHI